MNARKTTRTAKGVLWAACAAVSGLGAGAAERVWSGAGDDHDFSTNANWVGNVAPVPNDSLTFDGFARLTPVNDYGAGTGFNGIVFAPTAGPFNVTGNQIT